MNDRRLVGDFSVDKRPEDCLERIEKHLNGMSFTATSGSTGSTTGFHEDDARS